MKKNNLKQNEGMLVCPMFCLMEGELTNKPDLSHSIFFEDSYEGFKYKEEMEKQIERDKNSIYDYYIAITIRWQPLKGQYNPCIECCNRYQREYSEWCDQHCDYAKTIKEITSDNIRLQSKLNETIKEKTT